MKFNKTANRPPYFEATIYTVTAQTQALMTGNRLFRITNAASTDGKVAKWSFGRDSTGTGTATDSTSESSATAGSQEIMTGRLLEPIGDNKTLKGGIPVIWKVRGYGLMYSFQKFPYDGDATLTGTFNNILTRGTDGIITVVNQTSTRVVAGTIETGPTVSLKIKKLDLLTIIIEIARIGDGTTKYAYFVEVTNTSSFVPVLSLFKPDNAIYETGDPFGSDEGRILDSETELSSFVTPEDRERVINNVKVRYAGVGTGTSPAETAYASDTTFPEDRESIVQDPIIQDSATAVLLRDTILNMFKGTATGIKRAEAIKARADIYTTEFDAVLGDQVGIRDHGTEIIQDKFLAFSYDQSNEHLQVTVGLPMQYENALIGDHDRAIKRLYSGMTTAIAKTVGGVEWASGQPDVDSNAALANGSSIHAELAADVDFDRDADEGVNIYVVLNGDSAGGAYDIEIGMGTTGAWIIYHKFRMNADNDGDMYITIYVSAALVQSTAMTTNDTLHAFATNRTGGNRNVSISVSGFIVHAHSHDV